MLKRLLPPCALIVLLTMAGCSATPPAPTSTPAVTTAPSSSSAADAISPFPLDAYTMTGRERSTMNQAVSVLTNACVEKQGFRALVRETFSAQAENPLARRYGVMTVDDAENYGYHLTPAEAAGSAPADPPSATPRYSDAETVALYGSLDPSPTDTSGGGCLGESRRTVYGATDTNRIPLAETLTYGLFDDSQADPEVIAGFSAWSTCMAKQGYSAPDPLALLAKADLSTPQATPGEITTALADVACKQQTGLIDTWTRAEVRLQNAAIEKNAETLAADRDWIEASLRRAAKAVQDSR